MVSKWHGLNWKVSYRWCSGDLCCLQPQTVDMISFRRGCEGGSVARHRAAWLQCFHIRSRMGRRSVCANSISVAVECIPPVICSAASLWMDWRCFLNPQAFHPPSLLPCPVCRSLVPHASTAYRIFSRVTLSYNFLVSAGRAPFVTFAMCLHMSTYFVPFASVYAACSVKRSSWSMMTPRSLYVGKGSMWWLLMVIEGRLGG